VFAWDAADVESHVQRLRWAHETQRVSIRKQGKVMHLTLVHVADVFPLELTVYAPNELAQRPRSSTDGKPIVRLRSATLRALCAREHPELWRRYLADGSTPTLEEILAVEDDDSPPPEVLGVDELGNDATWLAMNPQEDDERPATTTRPSGSRASIARQEARGAGGGVSTGANPGRCARRFLARPSRRRRLATLRRAVGLAGLSPPGHFSAAASR